MIKTRLEIEIGLNPLPAIGNTNFKLKYKKEFSF